jgi:hypothetical protein
MRLGNRDLASPGRDQIGMVAGIRSEWVAGIVGIRTRELTGLVRSEFGLDVHPRTI